MRKQIICSMIFQCINSMLAAIPPQNIPDGLLTAFTMNGQMMVSYYYFDNSYPSDTPLTYSYQQIEDLKKKALNREENYYGATDSYLFAALDKYSVAGKKVAIIGSVVSWYESVVLAYGGFPVTIEYNKIISEHPAVKTINVSVSMKKNRRCLMQLFRFLLLNMTV